MPYSLRHCATNARVERVYPGSYADMADAVRTVARTAERASRQ